MPRDKVSYVCGECGYVSPGWLGRCPACGQWNTISQELVRPAAPSRRAGRLSSPDVTPPQPIQLQDIDPTKQSRIDTGLEELNRVLGGGLVEGSVVLVGGEPGVGKSTLLLQALICMQNAGWPTLLVSGEESAAQVKLRSQRLPGEAGALRILGDTQTEAVIACLEQLHPAVCVIDSVQTLWSADVGSVPGSPAQIRDAASKVVRAAKESNIAVVLVGHVTKEGELGGPRLLEHMVDAVLSFEGERAQPFRILRAVKNRFGSTNEVGVFQMTQQGLAEVPDPSSLFVEEGELRPGSAVVPVLEGSRCLLAEIQALVAPSALAVPQRVARGVERNRLSMIVAVLARRARLPILKSDIFVNVAGGLVVEDPVADLGVALAIVSSWRQNTQGLGVVAFGELSLTGRIRYALQGEKRVQELIRRGFQRILIPQRNEEEIMRAGLIPVGGRLQAVTDIEQAVNIVAERKKRE